MKKILIVEDESSLSQALELKMNFAGYETCCAYNGEEAIDILKSQKFGLILMDLVMPKMDGFELLVTLNSLNIKTPVIILTNLNQLEDKKKAMDLGAIAVMKKSDIAISSVVDQVNEFFK